MHISIVCPPPPPPPLLPGQWWGMRGRLLCFTAKPPEMGHFTHNSFCEQLKVFTCSSLCEKCCSYVHNDHLHSTCKPCVDLGNSGGDLEWKIAPREELYKSNSVVHEYQYQLFVNTSNQVTVFEQCRHIAMLNNKL